ncbi:nickel pincer cofactor biosynthesis protein LarC [Halomicroarcula limicola]|uniref:Putative nickel insertion protein n=1 Tax=Haloarcula limicola TaxID=1429915 RepID=A0A8J8C3Z0_9EURY|nr:nickel pincer cofactor biosynthesis protein LarC [Halomicroarcula limicola]MBV0924807.1 nickel pincer cofactor biosynthesis protein LarC [Halomicroarcula limicola]
MRTLAFDGRMGAAGDMLLGALLAAGADRAVLSPVEEALDVEYAASEVDRSGISATRVDVLLTDDDREQHAEHDHSHDEGDDPTHDHDPGQSHSHSHDDGQSHSHSHDDGHTHSHDEDGHTHAEGHGPNRSYAEVVDIVEEMGLDGGVEADALAIFEILGEAEASVHGTELAETHFHEVGADDAIADIVGAALLLDDLNVERVVTTPLSAGGGTVEMSHGTYPVPTPAVVEIAERADWSLRGGPVDAELLTPTGAAILAHVAEGVESLPSLSLDSSGYGAGGRAFEGRPNVLRAMVGEGEGRLRRDDITVLETNLDDASPELLGDLQRSLSAVGARDVSVIPATMKKSRPGHLVKVICKPENAERVARRLAEETGTLGVREHGAGHRWVAERAFETVALALDGEQYEVDVKLASDGDGEVYDVSAEFDDAAAVADATGLPVREVIRRAERIVRD